MDTMFPSPLLRGTSLHQLAQTRLQAERWHADLCNRRRKRSGSLQPQSGNLAKLWIAVDLLRKLFRSFGVYGRAL